MAVEFVDIPERGRRFAASFRVQLGDVDGRDEMHLETFGRFLQDVAADDVPRQRGVGARGRVGGAALRPRADGASLVR